MYAKEKHQQVNIKVNYKYRELILRFIREFLYV